MAAGTSISAAAPHDESITAAIHRYAGITSAALVLLQADDLAGETVAVNLPGTDRARPNWRRKLRIDGADLWRTEVGARAAQDFGPLRAAPGVA